MNVLIIGSGGREHALAWKIAQSERCDRVFVAPGNAGTQTIGDNLDIKVDDFDGIVSAIKANSIALVVIGPEDPLVKGLRNYLETIEGLEELMIIGPDAAGAQLEGSKDFSKAFMQNNHIPTAASRTFTVDALEEAYEYIESQPLPVVVKADGLAAGKGVIIASTHLEAKEALKSMLVENKFSEAGHKVLVEQFLDGIELSVFVLTDGKNYKLLPEAKDYKRIGEQDTGLNTGGMGAVSPVPFASKDFLQKVEDRIIQPTLSGLRSLDIQYIGFIFIGLMNVEGDPYVIEYNVRMGDPETQVVMPRLKSDLLEVLESTAKGRLADIDFKLEENVAATVVGVAGGYPESYEKGHVISGLQAQHDAVIFHAGTKAIDNKVVTNGGRVLAVTGYGKTINEALAHSYESYNKISWKDIYFRSDIGQDLLKLST